jgi:hypothetical protein
MARSLLGQWQPPRGRERPRRAVTERELVSPRDHAPPQEDLP